MVKDDLLSESIIRLDIEAENNIDAMRKLGHMLIDNKYIETSYIDNVILREKSFPTGLILTNIGIAIPHATPVNNVFKNGIAVARLKKAVKFYCMEDPEKEVNVHMVFMLALSNSNKHLDILKKLFAVFQNENLISDLQKSNSKTEFLKILSNNLA